MGNWIWFYFVSFLLYDISYWWFTSHECVNSDCMRITSWWQLTRQLADEIRERERELNFWFMWGDDELSAIKIVSNHWSLNCQRAHCNECILCDQLQQCRGYASSANLSAHVDHAFVRCICIVDAGSRFCVYQCPRTRYVKFYDRKCGPFKIYDSWYSETFKLRF